MIKIPIANVITKEQEYIDTVFNAALHRIDVLKRSLGHLNGGIIDVHENDFTSIKVVTMKIINKAENRKDTIARYSVRNYQATIDNYLSQSRRLVNLSGLNDLLHALTENDKLFIEAITHMQTSKAFYLK